jgi:hypothetical protein
MIVPLNCHEPMNVLKFENDGPLLLASNYWQSEMAAAGKLYVSIYGMPTRLLDWTTNPLVALFFACQGELSEKCETNGKLFVLDALTGLSLR